VSAIRRPAKASFPFRISGGRIPRFAGLGGAERRVHSLCGSLGRADADTDTDRCSPGRYFHGEPPRPALSCAQRRLPWPSIAYNQRWSSQRRPIAHHVAAISLYHGPCKRIFIAKQITNTRKTTSPPRSLAHPRRSPWKPSENDKCAFHCDIALPSPSSPSSPFTIHPATLSHAPKLTLRSRLDY
jgi:hypothetical protein